MGESNLTVAQMVNVTGVPAHTLRYYERVGLIRSVARNSGRQRRYSQTDIDWVRFLLRLRETGMSISTMRQYAELRSQGSSTLADRLDLLETHRRWLRDRIALLEGHSCALDTKISIYRTNLAEESGPEMSSDE